MRRVTQLRDEQGELQIRCLIRSSSDLEDVLEAAGAKGVHRYGEAYSAFVPLSAIEDVAALRGVESIRAARRLRPLLDVSVPATSPVGIRLSNPGFTHGGNTIVGVVDSGVDWTHPDFDDASSNSRILYSWDQNAGTVTQPSLGEAGHDDLDGHGTHVASITAGAGQLDTSYVGMAPGADIIAVATTFYDADIVEGVQFVFDRAAELGRPAVVNLSLGGHSGPHDGTDSFDRALDALSGPGQIVVVAAGNEGSDLIHAGGTITVATDDPALAQSIRFDGDINVTSWFDIYHDGDAPLRVWLYKNGKPSAEVVGPVLPGEIVSLSDVYIENAVDGVDPANGKAYVSVGAAMGRKATSDWRILLAKIDASDPDPMVHAWLYYSSGHLARIRTDGSLPGDASFTIGSPATARSTISVCAYVSKDGGGVGALGELAAFSSRGPTTDGRPGLDVCAPGSIIMAAQSSSVGSDGYVAMHGTSMAAPHISGLVASMLARSPTLSPAAVRTQLIESARRGDGYVPALTALPDTSWGWGKADADAGISLAAGALPGSSGVSIGPATVGAKTTLVARGLAINVLESLAGERYQYQWQRHNGTRFETISGANYRALDPTQFDVGDTLRVIATPCETHLSHAYDGMLCGPSVMSPVVVVGADATYRSSTPEADGWVMLSVPSEGTGNAAILNDFGGAFWRWDEQAQSYEATLSIDRGKGYFVRVGSAEGSMHTDGNEPSNTDFVTPLLSHTQSSYRSGRHLLGNPFDAPIYWQNLLVSADGVSYESVLTSSLIQPLYYGAYSNRQGQYLMYGIGELDGTIHPWEAFWVAVHQPVYLKIPANQLPLPGSAVTGGSSYPYELEASFPGPTEFPAGNAARSSAGQKKSSCPTCLSKWMVRLSAASGEARDDYNFFGLREDALNGWDRSDILDGGTMHPKYVVVVFDHPDWSVHAGNYCTDLQSLDAELHKWSMQVHTSGLEQEVVLSWRRIPLDWELVLVDHAGNCQIDMTSHSEYSFRPNTQSRRFSIEAQPRRKGKSASRGAQEIGIH